MINILINVFQNISTVSFAAFCVITLVMSSTVEQQATYQTKRFGGWCLFVSIFSLVFWLGLWQWT